MYKGKKNIGIRIFFLALFVSYFADINFFTHNHIINGVTIVHSHFSYNTPDSTSPDHPQNHSHSNSALNLISHAAVWMAVLLQAPEISCTALICNIIYSSGPTQHLAQKNSETLYLRGPPADYTKNL